MSACDDAAAVMAGEKTKRRALNAIFFNNVSKPKIIIFGVSEPDVYGLWRPLTVIYVFKYVGGSRMNF